MKKHMRKMMKKQDEDEEEDAEEEEEKQNWIRPAPRASGLRPQLDKWCSLLI